MLTHAKIHLHSLRVYGAMQCSEESLQLGMGGGPSEKEEDATVSGTPSCVSIRRPHTLTGLNEGILIKHKSHQQQFNHPPL